MYKLHPWIRNWTIFLLTVGALTLAACGPQTLVIGLEPTPTPTPPPTPVVRRYTNDEYGFAFRYPETWTPAEEPQHITLSQGSLALHIAYGWAAHPGFHPLGGRTGLPAGDLIYGEKVSFLGQVIPAQVLEYERRDKMVLYGGTNLVTAGDLAFSIWLEDGGGADYVTLDIPKEVQAQAKQILESFERTEATAQPPAPAPTPTASADKDLSTYVNDEYQLAFRYPSEWALKEIPAGQGETDNQATTVHLTQGTRRLTLQFKRADETTALGPGGLPAGEIEKRGTVTVLGREVTKQVLVFEDRVKSVFLSGQFDDLALYAQLDDGVGTQTDYAALDIPEAAQAAMASILSSLTRTDEAETGGADVLSYTNAAHGFSFQYPASWTVEEVTGETMDDGTKLADAVVLTQGRFKIIVQYRYRSDPGPIAWGGDLVPGGLGYGEATLGDPVTVLGEETRPHVWTYADGVKAMALNTTGKGADLILSVTLADGNVVLIQDREAETLPASAVAALDRVLHSFTLTP
jgi:hypothetical protein